MKIDIVKKLISKMNLDEWWCDDWCKIGAWMDQLVLNFIV
jgi:hypothetical protein